MNDLTKGSPLKLIFFFTIPLLIGNLFQQLYNVSDTVVVGQTLGVKALAAVGATGSINFLIIGFAQGLTAGLAIITATRYGAGDLRGVRRSFAASIVISILMTILLTILSLTFVDPILKLMQTPASIYVNARIFIRTIFAGIFASMAFNLLSNIIRALGDSRTPLIFLVIGTVVNVALELLFILVFHMGVAGAGWATVISQVVASLLCIAYIVRSIPLLHITWDDFRVDVKELWDHFSTGMPMGFQLSIIAIGTMVMQAALNSLGTDSVAASTAASKVDQLCSLPMSSFGVTMATFAAQNFGAAKYGRILEGVKKTLWLSGTFAVAAGALVIFFGRPIVTLIIGTADEHVIQLSQTYFNIIGSTYLLLSVLFIIRNTLQGLGRRVLPTLAGVGELTMRVFAALFMVGAFGYAGAVSAEPLAWLGSCAILVPSWIRAVRQLRNLQRSEEVINDQDDHQSGTPVPADGTVPAPKFES
ncbi:Na+-driven multidrug efflux pump [Levilactobacillus namurensis DSM 19117]|uniref:Na+-driven multidrug efflux pump n=1 Tax=Levilactobacillus namurensis DSM 19117 TaxID=1423773 RepID=A0A0R1JY43_9LACO|nr:MATE family efflux transporter [Levilactobacillus namurensis]KRK76048.1 Na+-driven multidrug efflux pump [Levilactobacillus namurensis DSM 19117]MCW3779474.1 MATE family efflux transporter [Levilactobacillus namurensis]MDT7017926.1 MATE family efflux transporter [Levilactobacillus namurensis]WNN65074.1 MATE family efflux transporter [Levilactobacillus namurensis]GEO74569.1 MATE family efflux transporter [Levilactobacillus namurensis]